MNVWEAIEALTAAAERTQLGLDTEIKVGLCDGSSLADDYLEKWSENHVLR